jgi:regulatory protein
VGRSHSAAQADAPAVRTAALALLRRRDFSRSELTARLKSDGYDAALIAQVLLALERERSLDDARYAHDYVSYHAGRGQGPVRIASALRTLGVAAELIDSALAGGPDWAQLARTVRARKFGAELPGSWAERGRQSRFLQYRGFSADHIRSALGPDFNPDE